MSSEAGQTGAWWRSPFLPIGLIVAAILFVVAPRHGVPKAANPEPLRSDSMPVMQAAAMPPQGVFYYLLDISRSTNGGGHAGAVATAADTESAYQRALPVMHGAILGMRGLSEALPQEHVVNVISDLSLGQAPVCDSISIPQANIFTGSDSAHMLSQVASCDTKLARMPGTQYTDIRGALKLAGMYLRDQPGRIHGIVIVSDMDEDRRPGTEASIPALEGDCVAVLQEITPETIVKPSLLDNRAAQWTALLRGWHAKDVWFGTTTGFNSDALVRFFRNCGRKS